jgi:hypothetical protein
MYKNTVNIKKGGEYIMKKKFLAVVSLAMVLAMESVTVFATETGSTSPNSGNVLYGDVTSVAATTLENVSIDALTSAVEVTIDETTGTVSTDTGLVFEKDEDNGLQLTQTASGALDLTGVVIKLDKENGHETKAFTASEAKAAAAVANYAANLGTSVGAEVQVSYAVNVEGSVDENGKPNAQVEFSVSGKNIASKNVTIIHVTDAGITENLGAEVTADGKIRSKKIPSSYSPFVLLVFDSPVPGLTTDIDYTTASLTSDAGTVAGDVSPKTADAYPYAASIAVVSLVAIAACSKKLANR